MIVATVIREQPIVFMGGWVYMPSQNSLIRACRFALLLKLHFLYLPGFLNNFLS